MPRTRMTRRNCSVGTRYLLSHYDVPDSHSFEATVAEWSPSGQRVRLKFQTGASCWYETLPFIVEKLAAQPPRKRKRK